MVNLVVADDVSLTTEAEIMRVLSPRGVAMIRESGS